MYFEEITKTLAPYPQFLYCSRNCIINMDKDGVITIKAKKIKIEAEVIVDVDGKVIDLN